MVLTRPTTEEVARDREVEEKIAANFLKAVCGYLPRGGTRIEATVDLEDWGLGTSPIEFNWDFGDGTRQVTQATRVSYREGARPMHFRQSESVPHAYERAGRYTLRVRVVEGSRESSCEYPITVR
jgi:PKD domain